MLDPCVQLQGGAVAEACPVACNRCTSHNATTLKVTTDLNGDCRLKPELKREDVPPESTDPRLTISARDRFVTLLSEETLVGDVRETLPFTVTGLRKRTDWPLPCRLNMRHLTARIVGLTCFA